MSHLDEGTLHALLDGELDLAEVSEVQKHLGTCVACGSRLQEVKQVLAESDRLVGAMEVPAGVTSGRAEPVRNAPPPPSFRDREPAYWEEPPVLLVPDPVDANARRMRWLRGLRWAAVLAVVVYGGKMIGGAIGSSHPVLPERDLTSAAPAVPPAVVSAEEAKRPETTLAVRQRTTRPQAQPPAPRAETRAPQETQTQTQRTARVITPRTDAASPVAQNSPAPDSEAFSAESADTAGQLAFAADTSPDTLPESLPTQSAGNAATGGSTEADELATRRAAAAALAELDRERRRQRANAATAALPPPARAESAPMETAPRPPTLEQRSQIYLRIGLDEAVRQLGGPVHVIEGMTPEFIGLTRTQVIPGSNTGRPVVRVVYTDARGRLILLDQQRMEGDGPRPSGSLRWTIGDVMLYLRGDVSTDVLRSLQARVR
jgi:anti-sigma factor RsiW